MISAMGARQLVELPHRYGQTRPPEILLKPEDRALLQARLFSEAEAAAPETDAEPDAADAPDSA